MAAPDAIQVFGDARDDGAVFGREGKKIGFFGTDTPAAKITITGVVAAGPLRQLIEALDAYGIVLDTTTLV